VPTELIRGDVFFWQGLMAATAIAAVPLTLAYGLLFERLTRRGHRVTSGQARERAQRAAVRDFWGMSPTTTQDWSKR
jgi:hypothetical protein